MSYFAYGYGRSCANCGGFVSPRTRRRYCATCIKRKEERKRRRKERHERRLAAAREARKRLREARQRVKFFGRKRDAGDLQG